jgi:hypothetical protein
MSSENNNDIFYIRKIFFVIELIANENFSRFEVLDHFKKAKKFEQIIISFCEEASVKSNIGKAFRILLISKEKVSFTF